ncbi:MAG: adaptor protein MecA [Lachnobacterium sp.]|nr:adaptor protein MecA [Lachnobacterium sp.]
MQFSRVGKHTIRCVISEQEILDMGYTMEEIMSNGERTQEFVNQIFDMAEQRFETKFDRGIKTVRADFMSDHTLALTFSEHPGSDEMMEHLKDIVNGLLNSIPQQKWKELGEAGAQVSTDGEQPRVLVTIVFRSMDILTRFAKLVVMEKIPFNMLYKYLDAYMLIMDLSNENQDSVKRLSALTDEYADDIQVGAQRKAFIEEHGEVIIKEKAIETLQQL